MSVSRGGLAAGVGTTGNEHAPGRKARGVCLSCRAGMPSWPFRLTLVAATAKVWLDELGRHPGGRVAPTVTALAIGNLGTRADAASPLTPGEGRGGRTPDAPPRSHDTSRVAWAKLIARIAEDFPLTCPACGGDIRLVAFITDPAPIRKILVHLGEPLEPPPLAPARGPPAGWHELVQAHHDRDAIQAAPDDLPVIDIRSL